MTCAPFATPRPRSALARPFRRSTNARHVRRRSPSITASASGARWAWAARTSMGWPWERTLAGQAGARGGERLARDLLRGARPRRGIRRLVAQEAAVALEVEEREDLAEGHDALARGQPVHEF